MRNCSKCEKAIWGIKGSGVKCATCAQSFHLECKESIVGQRQCVVRKKLDFSLKKLTYLQEVSVIPFAAPSLHVAGNTTPVMPHIGEFCVCRVVFYTRAGTCVSVCLVV